MDSDSTSPMRADARRNRDRLIEAARELFAHGGTSVPLADVAKAAGVGTGTAYRHFPTQEALVEATYRDEIARLRGAADELLNDHPPDEALALWLHRCIDYLATQRGLSEAMRAVVASGAAVHADSRAVIVAALNQLLDAAQAAGTVRTDVDALDVAAALGGIYLVSDPTRAHRVLAVFTAGLRTLTPPKGPDPLGSL
ncbi:TetR/AcrR family transcriptional regulator [Solirubrobacter ginsenosidimutans]|uniref:TetR/AcrR family transcriptional regulator n=1 Tax=Solirubrobacter ginsenosidimutans TaxID=490573 RepID=A0A9X3MQP3_9ACTN|nr:TetR/AcrR family transcriptional regulator [Solirubrobacter ginsenosidimutans]MDA0159440.1 TetR/AcrR family transcriptional regulator [Solirubrobacter ginsenosidimutans]